MNSFTLTHLYLCFLQIEVLAMKLENLILLFGVFLLFAKVVVKLVSFSLDFITLMSFRVQLLFGKLQI